MPLVLWAGVHEISFSAQMVLSNGSLSVTSINSRYNTRRFCYGGVISAAIDVVIAQMKMIHISTKSSVCLLPRIS